MATRDSVLDRVFPLFEHTHDAATTAVVVASAALLGLYASWIAADFGARSLTFAAAALALGYLLYRQATRREVVAAALYSLSALVALTPLLYELRVLTAAPDPLAHVLSLTDLLFVLLFWLLAAVPALAGYRLATGPLLQRLRS